MRNENLLKTATPQKFIEMGFVEEHDGSRDPRGTDWNIRNEKYIAIANKRLEKELGLFA